MTKYYKNTSKSKKIDLGRANISIYYENRLGLKTQIALDNAEVYSIGNKLTIGSITFKLSDVYEDEYNGLCCCYYVSGDYLPIIMIPIKNYFSYIYKEVVVFISNPSEKIIDFFIVNFNEKFGFKGPPKIYRKYIKNLMTLNKNKKSDFYKLDAHLIDKIGNFL